MRLILDTNVIVSALIQRGYPYYIVDTIFADSSLQLCISDKLMAEYVEVLNRQKFSRFPDFHARAQSLLSEIENRSAKYKPAHTVAVIKDEPDNRLLELAETCKADYLITGNANDFTMTMYKSTRIVSPKNFFEILNS